MSDRILTDEMIDAIRACIQRYPTRRALTLPALHIVNERLRHVPPRAVVEIAELLELTPAEVQDTLSFYGFFKQDRPHGRTRVWVCRSISCALRGADELWDYFFQRAGIRPGETSEDGRLTVEFAECLGACEHAPCMLANDGLCKTVTKEDIDTFLNSLPAAETQGSGTANSEPCVT